VIGGELARIRLIRILEGSSPCSARVAQSEIYKETVPQAVSMWKMSSSGLPKKQRDNRTHSSCSLSVSTSSLRAAILFSTGVGSCAPIGDDEDVGLVWRGVKVEVGVRMGCCTFRAGVWGDMRVDYEYTVQAKEGGNE
jgi:hypothetical protein